MSTSQLHKVLLKYFYIYITTSKEIAVMRKREVTSIFLSFSGNNQSLSLPITSNTIIRGFNSSMQCAFPLPGSFPY